MKGTKEFLFVFITALAATIVAALLFGIISMLVSDSTQAIKNVGIKLFSFNWYPVWTPPDFGILTMLLNSIILTVWTCIWVWTVGTLVATYLHMFAQDRERNFILRILEYISGVPSVVLGFFGIVYLSSLLLKVGAWSGQNFLNASIMLFVLTLPTMTSLTFESLEKVPKEIREGVLSLGGKDIFVMIMEIRYALPGIVAAMLTIFNRIFGETMIVLMVAGGANVLVRSLFDPVRPLTAAIGSEMGEVAIGSTHYSVLFFIGLILLIIALSLTLTTNFIVRKYERMIRG